jgi:hypothetical protein
LYELYKATRPLRRSARIANIHVSITTFRKSAPLNLSFPSLVVLWHEHLQAPFSSWQVMLLQLAFFFFKDMFHYFCSYFALRLPRLL